MIHINFIISLIKYVEKSKSCHFTLFLTHRKLCLCVKSQSFNASTKNIRKVQTNLEFNNCDTKVYNNERISYSAKEEKIQNENASSIYIKNHVKSINPQIAEICPEKYMKLQSKSSDMLYLFEEETAKKFVDIIIDDLSKNMTYVAEANPGTGVLTEELLKAGVTDIHAYEPNECFHPVLCNLQKKYPNRLSISKYNLFHMSKLHYLDSLDNKDRVKSIFMNVKSIPWEEKSCMQVIGAVTDFVFFKHLIFCVVFQSCFMLPGRTCFYLAIPPSIWNILNFPESDGRKYSRFILLQTLFNCKYLGDLKRTSYIPWQRERLSSKKSIDGFDHEILFVIKIEPRANLFVDYIEKAQLLPYWYFVKHHITSKKRRVIPELERWVPGCGIRLIAKNYNIFTQFVDLKPNEILNLYKEFASWPEYETCLFLPSANTYIQIMTQNKAVSCKYSDILDG